MRIINLSRLMILSGIFFIIFMSVPVYAKSLNSITDGAGYDLKCNEGNILSSGDVIFKLDTTLLNENEYYCRSFINDKGEESILLPVEDGIFTLEFGDAERIAFYIINEEDGSMKRIADGADGVFSVSFIDDTDKSIESELLYDRGVMINGVRYITGAAPKLLVAPVDAMAVFVKVTQNGKTVKHRVKDQFEMEFSQGSYGICVYGVTGKGKIIDGEESRFIYDCSGPTTPYLKFESETGGEQDGDNILFNSPLRLIPQSKDEYAGVSHYEFVFSDGSVQKGGSLLLEDDMKEKVTVYAVDRIGNYSEGVSLSGEMIIDTVKPVLKDISLKETEKGVVVRSEVKDELSGMGKQKLILNGKEIREETFDFKDRNKNLEREFTITDKELDDGDNTLKILLSDRIGNQRSYEYSIEKSDTRVPDIKLSGVENFKTYSEPVKAEIEISDEDSGIKKAFINVTKRDQNGNEISNRLYNNSSITFNEDGNYIIEIGAEDKEGNVRRVKRMFTVDLSAPEIEPLDSFNKKVLSSFAIEGNIKKLINDYSYVNVDMLLNGSDYDGSEVSTPGKYVLKLTATDEAGRSSSRKAEFIISTNEVKETFGENHNISTGIISGNHTLKKDKNVKKQNVDKTTGTKPLKNKTTKPETGEDSKMPETKTEKKTEDNGILKKLFSFFLI